MSPAGSRRLAWSACVLVLVAAVAAVTFDLKGASGTGYGAVGAAIPILFSALGALIASRQPRNAIGWIFCGIGLSFGLANLADEYAQYGLVVRPGSLPGAAVASWLSAWVWPPGSALFLVYLLLLFPSGKLPSRRWRLVGWLGGAAIVLAVLPIAVAAWPTRGPLLLSDEPAAAAPASLKFAFSLQVAAIILMFGLGLATATSLILRLRRAKGDEREQISGSRMLARSSSSRSSSTAPWSVSVGTWPFSSCFRCSRSLRRSRS